MRIRKHHCRQCGFVICKVKGGSGSKSGAQARLLLYSATRRHPPPLRGDTPNSRHRRAQPCSTKPKGGERQCNACYNHMAVAAMVGPTAWVPPNPFALRRRQALRPTPALRVLARPAAHAGWLHPFLVAQPCARPVTSLPASLPMTTRGRPPVGCCNPACPPAPPASTRSDGDQMKPLTAEEMLRKKFEVHP